MKIVILADSLALPRHEGGQNIAYEATYPFLLDKSLSDQLGASAPIIIERGMRRRTIEYVLDEWLEMVQLRAADVVIIHVGIVDCAPRVFLRREASLVARLRPARLRTFVFDFVHRHRRPIIQLRPRVYVPSERFKRLVEQVVEKAHVSRLQSLVFVNIIAPPDNIEERSPGFQQNVETYNRILSEQANQPWIHLIDLNHLIQQRGGTEGLTLDGIHINEMGHEILAHELETHIMGLLKDAAAESPNFK